MHKNDMNDAKEKWLSHLSNMPGEIKIIPYDRTAPEKFQKVRDFIQSKLGKQVRVEHRGATALGISGQDEIDVYVSVPPQDFDKYVLLVAELFGDPRSLYPLQRARFRAEQSGKKIDLFVINEKSEDWLNGEKFAAYLRENAGALEEYRKLKESGAGLSTQEYYRRKDAFIEKILTA
ncbi:MAG: GrpB family protein [Candidatus Paceibacterota bacterium]